MRTKNPEKARSIIQYVDSFFEKYRRSPSVREIETGTGIPRDTVHRYLVCLNECKEIEYDGSNIITKMIDRLTKRTTQWLPISGAIPCGEPQTEEELNDCFIEFPTSLLGKGEYFVLLADGESMTDAGIDDGDYVIVRKTNTADYGKIVVALDNDNRNTLKRLEFDNEKKRPYLQPENKKYEDIYPAELSIQGVAEKVIKNLI